MFGGEGATLHAMIEVKPTDNGRSAWCWMRRLGVACMCGHRSLVELEKIGAHRGDMKYLYKRKFKCSRCDRSMVQLWFMTSEQDEADFLASDAPQPAAGARP